MKTCLLALTAILFLGTMASAQPPDTMWTHAYGGGGQDIAFGVASISDGGFVAVGRSRSFSSDYGIFAVRVDAMGDTLWTRTYGGASFDQAAGVCEVSGNDFLIVGSTASYGAGSYDAYVIRISSAGDTLWTRTYGTPSLDYGYAIVPSADGGFALAGSTTTPGQSLNALLLKADANGNVIWQHSYGGTNVDEAFSLQQTSDNGYLLGGRSVPPGGVRPDMFAVRTNSAGDTLWTRRYGNEDWEEGAGAVETMDGGVFIAGWKQSISNNDNNFFVVRANANGNQQWSATYGGAFLDRATALRQSSDGGCILAGYTLSSGAGASDYYFLKFDTEGDTTWSRTCGGLGEDILYALDVTSDGGYIAAGMSSSYGQGGGDFWLVRLPGFAGVAGFVRDSVTNDPLPNVWVSAVGQPNRARTDGMGYFVLTLPPDTTYDIISYGQCVARDTAFAIPVFTDSLTRQDLVLGIPVGVVPQTSLNIVAYNHVATTDTLRIYNTGMGVLDVRVTTTTVIPASAWLSVNPSVTQIEAGDSALIEVTVTSDTTDTGVFDYYGYLTLHWNSCPDSVIQLDVIAVILDAENPRAALPNSFTLEAYPNPFNPTTTLSFAVPHDELATLTIYNVNGQVVQTLVDGFQRAGVHHFTINASTWASGVYLARLQTPSTSLTQKLLLLK